MAHYTKSRKHHVSNGPQPPHPKALVSPSQVFSLFDLAASSLSTIYYWTRHGFLPEPERSPSGRMYWRYADLKAHFDKMGIMPRI